MGVVNSIGVEAEGVKGERREAGGGIGAVVLIRAGEGKVKWKGLEFILGEEKREEEEGEEKAGLVVEGEEAAFISFPS